VLPFQAVAPNHITLASLAIGLVAAAAFTATSPFIVLAGLLAFHVHVLLDYVDGEVARCRQLTSVQGAYLDLMTDRLTFPLLMFCAGLGAYRTVADPALLIVAFVAAFGLCLDKFVVDAWYRANSGADEIEDRYVEAPDRSGWRLWRGRLSLLAVMARGLTAFLTYTVVAAFADAANVHVAGISSFRGLVLAAFAVLMPLGALVRFFYVYRRGGIPRRQQLL
jgi:phosphatidylglycerophosphate synthase